MKIMVPIFPRSANGGPPRSRSGYTLVEVTIAVGLGVLILGLTVATMITLTHSMAAISNYFQLDTDSRTTMNYMSRDVRNASTVTSISTNSLSMSGTDYTGNPFSFTYTWDGANLWRYFYNGSETNISLMLSNCNYLCFSNYMRVPNTNFTFYAAGTNTTKLISVTWGCSRSILGQKLNTESVQTANIVIRN